MSYYRPRRRRPWDDDRPSRPDIPSPSLLFRVAVWKEDEATVKVWHVKNDQQSGSVCGQVIYDPTRPDFRDGREASWADSCDVCQPRVTAPKPAPSRQSATVYEVRVSQRDRVRLLLATCDRCSKDVLHGGGTLSEPILLESRVTHCGCPGEYDLVLAPGVVA